MALAAQASDLQVARCAVFEEFLVWPEIQALTRFAMENRGRFRASQIVSETVREDGADPSYRRSRVTLDLGAFGGLISERLRSFFPQILRALGHKPFPIRRIEPQLTASNDGDFFKLHNDNSHANAPSREITFVYFFHREPRPFSGGELLIYDWRLENGSPTPVRVRKTIAPRQNEIVFFPSSCLHQVRRVECPSRRFEDSRFTLNGWIHA
jgi:SM-20-related protein